MKQFSIREFLLLLALVAVAIGWWIDSRRRIAIVPGRFQVEDVNGRQFLVDTATGQIWGPSSSGLYAPKIVE